MSENYTSLQKLVISQNLGQKDNEQPLPLTTDLLTIPELTQILNLKESAIRSLIFRKKIPFIKLGRLIRFNPREIDKWINANSIAPQN